VVDKVELLRSSKVRRAKLYYLRSLKGKAARLKDVDREQAVAEYREVRVVGDLHLDAFGAQRQRRGQVLLDGVWRVLLVTSEVHDAEASRRQGLLDAIAVQHVAGR